MMKKFVFFLIYAFTITTFMSQVGNAKQTFYKETWMTGHVKNVQDSLDVELVVWSNQSGSIVPTKIKVNIDSKGGFKMILPHIIRPTRANMYIDCHSCKNGIVLNNLIVDPGDSVHIEINDACKNELLFTGKGSAKYRFNNTIKQDNNGWDFDDYLARYSSKILHAKSFDAIPSIIQVETKVADSLIKAEFHRLSLYKSEITPLDYQIIKADLAASIINFPLGDCAWLIDHPDVFSQSQSQKVFNFVYCNLKKYISNEPKIIAYSPNYQNFIINDIASPKVLLSTHSSKSDFSILFEELKKNYQGVGRDALLVNVFYSQSRSSVSPAIYDKSLKKALNVMTSKFWKDILIYKTRAAEGSVPYNFRMPVDTSGKMLSLSDLKGSVVLVDLYGYHCGSCQAFTRTIHQVVWPHFKYNSQFKIVSIFGSYGPKDNWKRFLQRIRHQDENGSLEPENAWYTYPEEINLYGGQGIKHGAEDIENYYGTNLIPFVMLIGKDGKIICSSSTSFPFFTSLSQTNQIDQLITMIKKGLDAPNP